MATLWARGQRRSCFFGWTALLVEWSKPLIQGLSFADLQTFCKESPVANRAVIALAIPAILIRLAGVRSTFVAACSTGNVTAGSKGQHWLHVALLFLF